MNFFLTHIRRFDWALIWSAFAISGFGLVSIYSSSVGRGDPSFFYKQFIFLGVGVCAMVFVSFIDWRLLKNNPYLILALYGIGVVALFGLLLPFIPEIRGIKGWYRIGGISIDPIEFVKIVMIVLMAKYFSARHIEVYRMRHIVLTGIYFAVPLFLIFVQPDLGSAVALGILWIMTLLVAGIRFRHLIVLFLIAAVLAVMGWSLFLHPYQQERILGFLEPELDPLGIGWNQLQSKIAIGNGGIFGEGFRQGTQTQYGFLPEAHTDFVFSAIAEEFGLVGVAALFGLFAFLIARILSIGLQSQRNFPRLFAAGFATVFIVHIFINIGMNLGLLPIVGLPLTLVSYGGASLVMTFVGFGILQSIRTH